MKAKKKPSLLTVSREMVGSLDKLLSNETTEEIWDSIDRKLHLRLYLFVADVNIPLRFKFEEQQFEKFFKKEIDR